MAWYGIACTARASHDGLVSEPVTKHAQGFFSQRPGFQSAKTTFLLHRIATDSAALPACPSPLNVVSIASPPGSRFLPCFAALHPPAPRQPSRFRSSTRFGHPCRCRCRCRCLFICFKPTNTSRPLKAGLAGFPLVSSRLVPSRLALQLKLRSFRPLPDPLASIHDAVARTPRRPLGLEVGYQAPKAHRIFAALPVAGSKRPDHRAHQQTDRARPGDAGLALSFQSPTVALAGVQNMRRRKLPARVFLPLISQQDYVPPLYWHHAIISDLRGRIGRGGARQATWCRRYADGNADGRSEHPVIRSIVAVSVFVPRSSVSRRCDAPV
ncbi:hypothetical protein LX36DRAFT_123923 [Colletotrichum falcatum]|nr:hypothetical protein LX36DRAFT_123923 [Colletotrichum falcatum]